MEIIELRHDNARKAGRSTLRQKLICRARERHDAARRVASRRIASRRLLISSFASAIGFLRGLERFRSTCVPRGPIDRIGMVHAGEETAVWHDPQAIVDESYIRPVYMVKGPHNV